MKTTKTTAMAITLAAPILAFPLGWLYVLFNDLLGWFTLSGVITLCIFAPVVYVVGVALFLSEYGCKNVALCGISSLLFGIVAAYSNCFWFVHSELGVWLTGFGDLVDGMRICADMRTISLLKFISITGGTLMFFYWIEVIAIVVVLPILAVSNVAGGKSPKADNQAKENGGGLNVASISVALIAASMLFSGCSGKEDLDAVALKEDQVAQWVASQKWTEYPEGASAREFESSIGASVVKVVVGVGVAPYPRNEKLHEVNIKRTFVLALRKLPKLDKENPTKGVLKVFSEDVEFPDGKIRRVTALAKVK